jgi:hypothetical protein
MGAAGGAALRFGQTGVRLIQFLAAVVAFAIFSYFLAVLRNHHVHIPTWERAVEGVSGSAVLYLIFAVVLTLCLGGSAFFGLIAVLLDIAFVGGFIFVAWETRHGANSCKGYVNTPLGSGAAGTVFNVRSPGNIQPLVPLANWKKGRINPFMGSKPSRSLSPKYSRLRRLDHSDIPLRHHGRSPGPPCPSSQEGEALRSRSKQQLHLRCWQTPVLEAK